MHIPSLYFNTLILLYTILINNASINNRKVVKSFLKGYI